MVNGDQGEATRSATKEILASIEQLRKETVDSVGQLREDLQDNTRKTETILKAFPNGDTEGHRSYHEEVIRTMAEQRKLRQELITHLLKTSTWAALVGAFVACLAYFKIWIKS